MLWVWGLLLEKHCCRKMFSSNPENIWREAEIAVRNRGSEMQPPWFLQIILMRHCNIETSVTAGNLHEENVAVRWKKTCTDTEHILKSSLDSSHIQLKFLTISPTIFTNLTEVPSDLGPLLLLQVNSAKMYWSLIKGKELYWRWWAYWENPAGTYSLELYALKTLNQFI